MLIHATIGFDINHINDMEVHWPLICQGTEEHYQGAMVHYRLPRLFLRDPLLDPRSDSFPNATPPLPLLTAQMALQTFRTPSPVLRSILALLASPSNCDRTESEVSFSFSADISVGLNYAKMNMPAENASSGLNAYLAFDTVQLFVPFQFLIKLTHTRCTRSSNRQCFLNVRFSSILVRYYKAGEYRSDKGFYLIFCSFGKILGTGAQR